MLAWDDVFRMPQFWATYYETHIATDDDEPSYDDDDESSYADADADAELEPEVILARLFPSPSPAVSDAWRTFDLYNHAGDRMRSSLRMLARHDNDVERTVADLMKDNERADRERLAARFREALAHERSLPADKAIDLTFADGTIWRIHFAIGPADTHLLVEPGRRDLVIGWTGANFATPILRVEELERMCDVLQSSGRVPFDPKWLPMLLHPTVSVTSSDDVAHRRWITDAWRAVNLIEERSESIGDTREKKIDETNLAELVARTTRPLADHRWFREPARGWVNDFPHSHRNPRGGWPSGELGREFLDEGFDRFDRFATRCLDLPAAALRSV